jgi:dTDP-4-dehydrorhamnose reductase
MLGTELSLLFERQGLSCKGTDREVDITNRSALVSFAEARQEPIDWIVNCAAYTAVDKAEDEKENCRLLNTEGAGNIAFVANKINAGLIHISTDYVFNGRGNKPFTEEDITDPIGVYGITKRDGEIEVLKEYPRSFIFRTAWLYGKHGNNFVHTMLRLMNERESVFVVNDQKGSPTWAYDLSEAISCFIRRVGEGNTIPHGIYHFTNEGEITWFDFAKEIYDQGRTLGILNRVCEVKPCTSAEYPAKVKRPAYSVLHKAKITKTFGLEIPDWKNGKKKYFKLRAKQE